MTEPREEIHPDNLSAGDLQELLGDLGQQLTVEQLRQLLVLVNSSEDLDEALAALEHVDRAA